MPKSNTSTKFFITPSAINKFNELRRKLPTFKVNQVIQHVITDSQLPEKKEEEKQALGVRLPSELHEKIKEEAKKRNMSASKYIGMMIDIAYKRHNK